MCAPRPEPTEAAADMKLARDAMAAGQTQTREVPCRGRAVRKGLAACLVCSLCLVGHEGMRNLGPTKAAADLKLARDGAAAAKRKLAGFRAGAEQ